MTQREAAERARTVAQRLGLELELHPQTISDYERGAIATIPFDVVRVLSVVYGSSPTELGARPDGLGQSDALGPPSDDPVAGHIGTAGQGSDGLRVDPDAKSANAWMGSFYEALLDALGDGPEADVRIERYRGQARALANGFRTIGYGGMELRTRIVGELESFGVTVLEQIARHPEWVGK